MIANLPPTLVNKAVSTGVELVFRFLESRISQVRFDKADSHQDADKPCTTCLIHQHVVLAHGYIKGLRSRLNPDGSVPEGLGGTIAQAREHLKEAMNEIPSVVGAHPTIDAACKKLAELLPDIAARMDYISSLDEWDSILLKLELAVDTAYAIPEAMYRREPVKVDKPQETIVVLGADDKALLDLVGGIRRGEISEDDAKAALALLLSPEA